MGYVEWSPGDYRGIILVDGHPGTKGNNVSPSEDAIRAAKGHMGSVLIN